MSQSEETEWGAFVCSHVYSRLRPCLLVTNEEDGWSFVCGHRDHDDKSFHVVGVVHLLDNDPTLQEVLELKVGWQAERTSMSEAWRLTTIEPDHQSSK